MAPEAMNKNEVGAGVSKAAAAPVGVEEEQAPTMWETVRGVFFVLGVACALTISFTLLSAYERSFTAVTYSDRHVAAAAEPQREKQKLIMPQKSYLMPSPNSRALAA